MRTGILLQIIGTTILTPLILKYIQKTLQNFRDTLLNSLVKVLTLLKAPDTLLQTISNYRKQQFEKIWTIIFTLLKSILINAITLTGLLGIILIIPYIRSVTHIPFGMEVLGWVIAFIMFIVYVVLVLLANQNKNGTHVIFRKIDNRPRIIKIVQKIIMTFGLIFLIIVLFPIIIMVLLMFGIPIIVAEILHLVSCLPIENEPGKSISILSGWSCVVAGLIIQYLMSG